MGVGSQMAESEQVVGATKVELSWRWRLIDGFASFLGSSGILRRALPMVMPLPRQMLPGWSRSILTPGQEGYSAHVIPR